MKLMYILIALAFITTPLLAQEKQEPNRAEQTDKKAPGQDEKGQSEFIDADGDGINDHVSKNSTPGETAGQGRQLRQHRRDRFIDQDGDGISDDRCSGTGIRQGRRHGAAKGGGQ